MAENIHGKEHCEVAISLNNLAALHALKGHYIEAEPLHLRALAIMEKVQGAENLSTSTSLFNLAFLYKNQGLYSKVEPLYKRALAIIEKSLAA